MAKALAAWLDQARVEQSPKRPSVARRKVVLRTMLTPSQVSRHHPGSFHKQADNARFHPDHSTLTWDFGVYR